MFSNIFFFSKSVGKKIKRSKRRNEQTRTLSTIDIIYLPYGLLKIGNIKSEYSQRARFISRKFCTYLYIFFFWQFARIWMVPRCRVKLSFFDDSPNPIILIKTFKTEWGIREWGKKKKKLVKSLMELLFENVNGKWM